MDVGNNSHQWFSFSQNLKEISTFLQSIDPGDGLVYYDPDQFLLLRRSWFSNPYIQKIVNFRNPQATFTQTKVALEALNDKIASIYKQLVEFPDDRFKECKGSTEDIVECFGQRIPEIVALAHTALIKLAGNYEDLGKKEKGEVLLKLGKKALKGLKRSREVLFTRFLLNLPDRKPINNCILGMETLIGESRFLAQMFEQDRKNLGFIAFSPKTGVTLPKAVPESFHLKDETDLYKRLHVGLPPMKNEIEFFKIKKTNRISANYRKIPSKATAIPAQGGATHWNPLCPVLNEKKDSYVMGRGVVGICTKKGIGDRAICNLYFKVDALTARLVMTCSAIDMENKVLQLGATFAYIQAQSLKTLVNGRIAFHSVISSEKYKGTNRSLGIEEAIKKQCKREDLSFVYFQTCFVREKGQVSHDANLEILPRLIKYVLSDTEQILKKDEFLFSKESFLLKQYEAIESTIGTTGLIDEIKKMDEHLRIAAEYCQSQAKGKESVSFEKAQLLFNTLRQVISFQLNPDPVRNSLPIHQLEWLLFLYRQLNIAVVFESETGLAEGSAVAAMADAQSQIERMIYQELPKKPGDAQAWLMARKKMFDLIQQLPEKRDHLMRRFAFGEYKGISSSKLVDWNSANNHNVREQLLKDIELCNEREKEMLKLTLYYMESVADHLLHTEGIKALNSSGRLGLLIKKVDCLNRMAPFVRCENKTFQLSDLCQIKAFDTTSITDFSKAFLMHLKGESETATIPIEVLQTYWPDVIKA